MSVRALVPADAGVRRRPSLDRTAVLPDVDVDHRIARACVAILDAQRKEVGRAAKLVIVEGPDQSSFGGERDGPAEQIGLPVARDEPLLRAPGVDVTVSREDVGRAATVIVSERPDESAVAGE